MKMFGDFQRQTNKNGRQEDLDMAKKGKPQKRNRISSNSSTKQRHKDQLY